jgi:acyl-coenzyme A thioesterase PaaI-like protein
MTKVTSEQYRALALLADTPRGCLETVLVDVEGFTVDALAELLRAGYASVAPETVRAGGRKIEVARVKITDAGRRAIAH